jgi:hypothetical protein
MDNEERGDILVPNKTVKAISLFFRSGSTNVDKRHDGSGDPFGVGTQGVDALQPQFRTGATENVAEIGCRFKGILPFPKEVRRILITQCVNEFGYLHCECFVCQAIKRKGFGRIILAPRDGGKNKLHKTRPNATHI